MKRHIYLFLFLYINYGCFNKPKFSDEQIFQMVQGDWVGFESKLENDNDLKSMNKKVVVEKRFFSFHDSLCTEQKWGTFSSFSVKNQFLLFNDLKLYKIYDLTEAKMTLIPTSVNNQKGPLDTIKLEKITQKNTINISRITFSSTGCFGECPSMLLDIDSLQNMRFIGRSYTDLEGDYSGKVPDRIYQMLLTQIRNIKIDSLQENYQEPVTDQQSWMIVISYDNKNLKCRVYGYFNEPEELRFLIHSLSESYKFCSLKKDTLNGMSFVIPDIQF